MVKLLIKFAIMNNSGPLGDTLSLSYDNLDKG